MQETGKHAHAETTEGNANTEQEQNRIGKGSYTRLGRSKTGNGTSYCTDHGHDRGKNLTNRSKQCGHYLHPLPIRILINFATKVKQTKLKR